MAVGVVQVQRLKLRCVGQVLDLA